MEEQWQAHVFRAWHLFARELVVDRERLNFRLAADQKEFEAKVANAVGKYHHPRKPIHKRPRVNA